jgi:hypothetical protein
MRRGAIVVAILCAGVATAQLAAAAGPAQPLRFGVADDTGKYASDGGAAFFAQLASLGLRDDRMSVTWDAAHPSVIADRVFLDRSIAVATAEGVQIRLSVRPARSGCPSRGRTRSHCSSRRSRSAIHRCTPS